MISKFIISLLIVVSFLLLLSSHLTIKLSLSREDSIFEFDSHEYYDTNQLIHRVSFSSENEDLNKNKLTSPKIEQFSENSEQNSNFNIAIVGDWGCNDNTKKTVQSINNYHPDLIFSLGDTSYGTEMDCWLDIVEPISDRMKAVIGNHDYMSPDILINI